MAKFVKADVLHHARKSTTKLQKIDIDAADNLKPLDKIDVRFTVKGMVDAAVK